VRGDSFHLVLLSDVVVQLCGEVAFEVGPVRVLQHYVEPDPLLKGDDRQVPNTGDRLLRTRRPQLLRRRSEERVVMELVLAGPPVDEDVAATLASWAPTKPTP